MSLLSNDKKAKKIFNDIAETAAFQKRSKKRSITFHFKKAMQRVRKHQRSS